MFFRALIRFTMNRFPALMIMKTHSTTIVIYKNAFGSIASQLKILYMYTTFTNSDICVMYRIVFSSLKLTSNILLYVHIYIFIWRYPFILSRLRVLEGFNFEDKSRTIIANPTPPHAEGQSGQCVEQDCSRWSEPPGIIMSLVKSS